MRSPKLLAGWGRTAPTGADLVTVDNVADARTALDGPRGAIARGLGRSYGDPAQNAGGRVLDLTGWSGIHAFDDTTGIATVAAGTSLDHLLRWAVPRGRFVPVTPGTRFVTMGGAVASDIHGKNHHRDGSFGNAVTRIRLLTAAGDERDLSPGSDEFRATVGGMGLTGVITEIDLRLPPIESSLLAVDTEKATDFDDCLARLTERDHEYHYSVSWIDLDTRGRRMGRAILTRGDFAKADDLPAAKRRTPLAYGPAELVDVPLAPPAGLINGLTVKAFNVLWFAKARPGVGQLQTIPAFFHPLDAIGHWNRAYGPSGFLQHQFVVPFGAEDVLRRVVERLATSQYPAFLGVLKRFGPGNDAFLSFPQPGWTLTLDVPAGARDLAVLLDELDRWVVEAGGRLYLAKDSRMRPDLLARMYPELDRFKAVRARLDPDRRFQSDLSRRLGL